VTVTSELIDSSLGFEIHIPVLMCHDTNMGYKQISWYKDFVLVRRGGANLSDHILSLSSLINNSSRLFQHPLKLQGYYWCQTDSVPHSIVRRHLFRIKGNCYYRKCVIVVNHYARKSLKQEKMTRSSKTKRLFEPTPT